MQYSTKKITLSLTIIILVASNTIVLYAQEYNTIFEVVVKELKENYNFLAKDITSGELTAETATGKWLHKIWELRAVNETHFEKKIEMMQENINSIYQLDSEYSNELQNKLNEIISFRDKIKEHNDKIMNQLESNSITAIEAQNMLIDFANNQEIFNR